LLLNVAKHKSAIITLNNLLKIVKVNFEQ